MIPERAKAARVESEQRHALRYHIANEVRAYSPWWRQRLDQAGISSHGIRRISDLGRLPPLRIQDADPAGLVLRPDRQSVAAHGRASLAWRLRLVRMVGGAERFLRTQIEPDFKPIHWLAASGLPIGCSETDLERLAELGQRWLEAIGLQSDDAIVSVLPATPSLAFWELTLGARLAGIPLAALGPGVPVRVVQRLGPTMLAGRAGDLLELLNEWRPDRDDPLSTIVVMGGPRLDAGSQRRLRDLAPGADVLEAWAPPGVRSLWFQCRRGTGLHTEPSVELLETVDRTGHATGPGEAGEIVWTSIGWRGSVFVRLATGAKGQVTPVGPCPACHRTSPRVLMEVPEAVAGPVPERAPAASVPAPEPARAQAPPPPPPPAREPRRAPAPEPAPEPEPARVPARSPISVLDRHPGVASWQVERRGNGTGASLVVYLATKPGADLADVLSTVDDDLGAAQYVVLSEAEVRSRLRRAGGAQVVDVERSRTAR